MPQPVSPEFKLLCDLLPVHFRGAMPWPSEWQGVDPAAFFNYVLKTQVAPLALHHWETKCPALWDATPFEIRARLVAWLELFRHKQLARFASWRELLSAFAAAGLPVIPLKGFALSEFLYADPFLRQSSDFDLLIRRADLPAADALLRETLGCRRVKWHGPRAACEAGYARAGADPESAWNVDLHWDVVPRWHFLWRSLDGAWDHALPFSPQRHEAHQASQEVSMVVQKQQESSLCPLCLCGESTSPDLLTLSPSDTAWFALANNVSDYGLGNLRGCIEALELLAHLDGVETDRFRAAVREACAGRALAALEAFRARFFSGSEHCTVARLAPARRLSAARHFTDERLYVPARSNGIASGGVSSSEKPVTPVSTGAASAGALSGTAPAAGAVPANGPSRNGSSFYRAPLFQRAAIRLALAGPGPRFARFCAGKLYEAFIIRTVRLKDSQISRLTD